MTQCEVFLTGWKLMRKRKDGTYGPLFINRKQKLESGVIYKAECHPTKGFAVRPGFHICQKPDAPHLSKKGRVWCFVAFNDYQEHLRPVSQGGLWYTANQMVILGEDDKITDDLDKCPNCGGPADNGFSREIPPSPYFCTTCMENEHGS